MAMFAGMFVVFAIVAIIIYLVMGFSLGKLFQKAGKPMWAGFVPIYNIMVILEIVGRPMWWLALLLLGFIPFVGSIAVLVVMAIVYIDFAKSYGKGVMWGILILLFGVIVLPIMAFSDDVKYIGPAAATTGSPTTPA
jgi:hypothetical protein